MFIKQNCYRVQNSLCCIGVPISLKGSYLQNHVLDETGLRVIEFGREADIAQLCLHRLRYLDF